MFWGVTIENGKKYSQIVEASYHLSMAALEPTNKNSKDGSKFVSVMLEHMKTEFLLCTLEHNKKLQCKLDLVFQEGEEVTFYLNGEGTVHLTGYLVGALDSEDESDEEGAGEPVPKKSPIKMKAGKAKDSESDDDDEEDDDWAPTIMNASGKRPLNGVSNNSAKKLKSDDKAKNASPEKKSGKQQGKNIQSLFNNQEAESDDEDEDDDDDEDDDLDLDDDSSGDDSDGLQISSDDDEDSDDDDEDEEESEQWGLKAFPGIQDKKNAGSTPGPSQKKNKQGQTPQSGKFNQKQKTPQGGKSDQKQKTPPSGKANNQKTPQTGKKNQNQSPNQNASAKKGGTENSFNKTPGGKKQKQKKQGEEQTPNQSNKNQSIKNEGQQTPKSPGGQTPKSPGGKAKKLQGGVQVEEVIEGKGPVAKPGKYVHVYYTGKLPNNKEFDSLTKGKPFGFRLGKGEVIKGWDTAIDGMKVGGKRKIIIPPHMGYGNKNQGPIPANSTLHFDVELKAVN